MKKVVIKITNPKFVKAFKEYQEAKKEKFKKYFEQIKKGRVD